MFFVMCVLESSCLTAFDLKLCLSRQMYKLIKDNWFANTAEMKLHTAIKKKPNWPKSINPQALLFKNRPMENFLSQGK